MLPLLSALVLSLPHAHAEDAQGPSALVYTHGARVEIEAALGQVEAWLAAARRRDDVDERLCLQAKLHPMLTYAEAAGGAALLLREHLAAGDAYAAGIEVRKVSVAVDRTRRLHAQALACLEAESTELSVVEDPDLFRHETDLGQTPILTGPTVIEGGCKDDVSAPASPC